MICFNATAYETMIADARQAFPDECCGFLFGHEKGENRIISECMAVHNAKEGDKKRRFEIAPRDYLKAEQYALENEVSLLGIYHSHPLHPAVPSEHDRVAAQPFFSYVIVSVSEQNIENTLSWRLNDEHHFEPENITLPSIIQQ